MFILKQLRRKKNINQTDLAKAIGVSLRTIQLYEKKDANIPIKNLTKIAQYFDVTIAELYSHENVNEKGAAYDTPETVEKGHIITKLAPGKYLIYAPLLLTEQYGKFSKQYAKKVFVQTLPRIGFVLDRVSVAHYMAFEISNNSMDDGSLNSIPFKSVVLGKLVQLDKIQGYMQGNPNGASILVYKGNVMCKVISDYNKKTKTVVCKSLNDSPEYSDFEIKVGEIDQLYAILGKQIAHI
ncbi:helix-turn-helix transcriptional regulator [Ulvibacterium marinum]|uniref:helix-turn-helix transcriptional regulator n=1 Tax=Ulvibacterium marinum TaxID=2419782 RepID=UPI002495429B|nr:helix-turn-helix transcriptional regulator [Ulvibacterium marinum]